MTQTTNSTYKVLISTPNSPNTNYTISATGRYDKYTCQSRNNSCKLTQLSCGTIYEVTAVASTAVGKSLPGYSKTLETGTTVSYGYKIYVLLKVVRSSTFLTNSDPECEKYPSINTWCLFFCLRSLLPIDCKRHPGYPGYDQPDLVARNRRRLLHSHPDVPTRGSQMSHSRHSLPDGLHHLWHQLQRPTGRHQQHGIQVPVPISRILIQWEWIHTHTHISDIYPVQRHDRQNN